MEQHPRRAIFISYARKDGEAEATALRQRLEREALDVGPIWMDRARMEGGRPWWTQIEGALDRARFLILIMTQGAVESPVVRQEWSYARQEGVCVYPVLVGKAIDFAELPKWMSKAHFFDLEKQWPTVIQHLRSPCEPFRLLSMAPELPSTHVCRAREMESLRKEILEPKLGDPIPGTLLLTGTGGFGKSTVAAALCNEGTILEAFDDGILWVTLGEEKPDLVGALTAMFCELTNEQRIFPTEAVAAYELARKLEKKSCLIIIDDVWRESDVRPFLRGGRDCTRIITSRFRGLVPDARVIEIGELQSAEAQSLLLGGEQTEDARPFKEFAKKLGHWPLLVSLASAAIRRSMRNGESADGALRFVSQLYDHQGVVAFDRRNASERNDAVARSLDASLEFLTAAEKENFFALGVFPPERDIPLSTLAALWGTTPFVARKLAEEFADLSLLRFDARVGAIRLHAVIQSALANRISDLAGEHRKLVRGWGNPNSLPDEYSWRSLGYHMIEAGEKAAFQNLLTSYEWMERKLERTDLKALIQDYDRFPEEDDLQLIRATLRLAAHKIAQDRSQFAGQLLGRLMRQEGPRITTLQEEIRESRNVPSLRPLTQELTPPGGPLMVTLVGHGAKVKAVAITPDEKYVVSGSGNASTHQAEADSSIRIWDMKSGFQLRVLEGHKEVVKLVSVLNTPGGFRIVSASADGTLREWDFDSGEELRRFDLPDMPCYGMTSDGRRILSSSGKSIVEWEWETGKAVRALEGHTAKVTAVATSPDGQKGISAGRNDDYSTEIIYWDFKDGRILHKTNGPKRGCQAIALTGDERHALVSPPYWESYVTIFDDVLKLWDFIEGREVLTLRGHQKWINAIAVTADGQRAVTASDDRLIKIWDLQKKSTPSLPAAHAHEVRTIAVTPDGKGALSASGSVYKPGEIKYWDLETKTVIFTLEGHERGIIDLAVTPDGRFAVSGSYDETVRVWNLRKREHARTLPRHSTYVNAVAVSPDGRRILSASGWGGSGDFYVWNLKTSKQQLKLISENIMSLAVTPDSRHVVCAGIEGTVIIWDLKARSKSEWLGEGCQLKGHTAPVRRVAVTPDGRHAISASWDGTLKVWIIEDHLRAKPIQDQIREFMRGLQIEKGFEHAEQVRTLAADIFAQPSPHASELTNDINRLRELTFGLMLLGPTHFNGRTLAGHRDGVNAVALTSDGSKAVSASDDHSIRVWDLVSGQAITSFTLECAVLSCAISPCGVIVAGDESGRVHFFELVGIE